MGLSRHNRLGLGLGTSIIHHDPQKSLGFVRVKHARSTSGFGGAEVQKPAGFRLILFSLEASAGRIWPGDGPCSSAKVCQSLSTDDRL